MKCFLHIGTEKTATTSIQSFLTLNRETMYEYGFFYPSSLGKLNSIKLAVAAYHPKRSDDISLSMGITTDGSLSLEKFKEKVIRELMDELKPIQDQGTDVTLLLSSEHFHSRLTRIKEIESLKSILEHIGVTQVFVIVYLRNPTELVGSLFSTAIKSGAIIAEPPPPSNPYFNNVCNHKNTLEKFGQVFGESSLIPRIFHKNDLIKESVIYDFLSALKINSSEDSFLFPEVENESLSNIGIEILKRLNRSIPRISGSGINPLRGNIVSYFEKHLNKPKYAVSPETYKEYKNAFMESNEWVRKKYFPEKDELFKDTFYQDDIRQNLNDYEYDCISALISDIWIEKSKIAFPK